MSEVEKKNKVRHYYGLGSDQISNLNAGLFLFFLVLVSNFTMDRILPNSLIRYLEKSRAGKHIIAFLILLFTINLYSTDNKPFYIVIGYVILLWLWFLITTKMHLLPIFLVLILLLVSYICYNVSKKLEFNKKLQKERQDRIKYYLNKIQIAIFYLVLIITLIGGTIYFIEKYKIYRTDSTNLLSFIFKFYFLGTGSKSVNV
jgi:hypothetical protein